MSKSVVAATSNGSDIDQDTNRRQYRDHQGVDTEEFIRQTIQKHPKDRNFIMALEREMLAFIINNDRPFYAFSPMSSYQRMLVHRVAAYFGLDHNVDQTGQIVIVSRTKQTRIPETSFKDLATDTSPVSDNSGLDSAGSTIFRPRKFNGIRHQSPESFEQTSEDQDGILGEKRVFENRKYRSETSTRLKSTRVGLSSISAKDRLNYPIRDQDGRYRLIQLISSSVRTMPGTYLDMITNGIERLGLCSSTAYQQDNGNQTPAVTQNIHNFYPYLFYNNPMLYGSTVAPGATPNHIPIINSQPTPYRWPNRLFHQLMIPAPLPVQATPDMTVIAVEIISGLPPEQTVYVGRSMVASVFGQWALKILFFGTVDGPVTDLTQLGQTRIFVLLCRPFSFNMICSVLGCSTPGGIPPPSGLYITPCIDQDMITRIVQHRSTLPTYNYILPMEMIPIAQMTETAPVTTTASTDDTDTSTAELKKATTATAEIPNSKLLVQPSNG
ncbi:hypothetical protein ACOME3_004876 [Neoechinorhynchus agilis]